VRRLRYSVAATLDGYIAGPNGEFDWIPHDPTVDFEGLFARVDTVIMGRRTYEMVLSQSGPAWKAGTRVFVVSRTLRASEHPDVTIVSDDPAPLAASLRAEEGAGEIWLFGGGELFSTLLDAHQVDAVEVTVCPVLLGGGIPLLATGLGGARLTLTSSHVYPTGMVALHYAVADATSG
jgi:dihydrofolate reductase